MRHSGACSVRAFRTGALGAMVFGVIALWAMVAFVAQNSVPAQLVRVQTTVNPTATDIPITVARVAEAGTPFPTNIAHAPPTVATATPSPTPTPMSIGDTVSLASPTPAATATLAPENAASERFILVNQDEQRMRIFENGREVRVLPISTGKPVTNAFTPPWSGTVGDDWGSGIFRGTTLYSDFMWFLFPGPEGSILIHSVPYQKVGTEKQYDRLEALGVEPVSNGCIRISPEDAAWLKQWNPVGVPIEITRWSGKISAPAE